MKKITSKIVFEGNFVTVRHDTVEDTDGNQFVREIVRGGEGVLVAAIENNKIALIKQHRENHGDVYEVPAGSVDSGETPLQAAKRELHEEAGITAKSFKLISKHHNGVHDEGYNYYFLATYLSFSESEAEDDEQIYQVEFVSFPEARKLIEQDKIVDIRNRGIIWLAELMKC